MSNNILFIDRDGTIVSEPTLDYQIDTLEKIVLEPHVITTLLNLKKLGYCLVLFTNQDGLGSNCFPFYNFYNTHNFILQIFRSQGVIFDDILICPHKPEDNCECRKPKLQLLKGWIINNLINKNNSYVIGDRLSDMKLAQNIGIQGLHYKQQFLSWIDIEKKITNQKRCFSVFRNTKETSICIKTHINNNKGLNIITTGIGFFDHMLEQIAVHSGINFDIHVLKGDLNVDEHHTVEDTALVLGKALYKVIRYNKKNNHRFGFMLPMDESISHCVLDISNRPYLVFNVQFKNSTIGNFHTEMIQHFFRTLVFSMKITLHFQATGNNDHHLCEALFKSFGQTLRQAIKHLKHDVLLSSKGIL
ncbi:bifunctional histidinol-phosphatase/imidazoleglycerol-phosphate dehydratase HisB [Buchnera aphidicola (Thelaxes californica)]|uniref:Imidazoleglycerol-phosphate dehydratase n=1 Tax=Buchnera aphidicola (Thelaxes californica) TaxID=1315998 RepID=A0A4D6YL19_9GAMM|nr:bifunctional histidinol-phosphatase/imidazoleglycerol-phosphate dehydratase HisB [Buchnera aphidicola]QCI26640.1 bifunctional histidinol-phosphatase/imidazoleglycerol-phosphate dehydratase HisB [Buchnera aphidicola (Thelaxes californica)]